MEGGRRRAERMGNSSPWCHTRNQYLISLSSMIRGDWNHSEISAYHSISAHLRNICDKRGDWRDLESWTQIMLPGASVGRFVFAFISLLPSLKTKTSNSANFAQCSWRAKSHKDWNPTKETRQIIPYLLLKETVGLLIQNRKPWDRVCRV